MDEKGYYRHWDEPQSIEAFASKTASDFFRSEVRFLADIADEIRSVLDVGCSADRFIALPCHIRAEAAYTGIDISRSSVERGRELYPPAKFLFGNALDLDPGGRYDLINATGVCQHEPQFEKLVRRMGDWSSRYVLFDVKLAAIADRIIDIEKSYHCREPRLLDILTEVLGIASISVFGYATPTHPEAVVPKNAGTFSTCVFLRKGDGDAGDRGREVRIDLPKAARLP